MKVLVINCGSSSLKYQLLNMDDETTLVSGLCERIGIEGSRIVSKINGKKETINLDLPDHNITVGKVLEYLVSENGVINSLNEISAVGHRVVHGGESFTESVLIDDGVKKAIKEAACLAPLHNPANLIGIEACQLAMPDVPHIAVFDTAFHQTIDEKAYLYAIPYEYYLDHKIRRYGFHGTSHKYVVNRTAEMLGKRVEDLKVIVCHLGNGASVCAIDKGKSVETSMGLTPLEGLVMGTRSGDLDPAVVELIAKKEEKSLDEVVHVLNKESGVKGLSGLSSDFRDLEEGLAIGSKNAKRALDVYIHRVIKYIGAYAAVMNGVDALVFTAGVGENDPYVRERITRSLSYLGVEVDRILNECRGVERRITKVGASTETLVIPTNEELMMSREAVQILEGANGN